jgi:hypothetical protein
MLTKKLLAVVGLAGTLLLGLAGPASAHERGRFHHGPAYGRDFHRGPGYRGVDWRRDDRRRDERRRDEWRRAEWERHHDRDGYRY